jgi:outer membrane protein assembly factor BamB
MVPVAPPSADDWPCWRGPGGGGVRAGNVPGLHWSETSGVLWRVPVPGVGHASPIVVGDRVIVSTADEQAQTRSVICYDRATGGVRWSALLHQGAFMGKHEKNSHASPTPACDGRQVYVPYIAGDALWLSAINVNDGNIAWQPRVGPFVSEWGYASSPVLYKDLVIVAGDNRGSPADDEKTLTSYLAAVHRGTGEIAWRVRRPLAPNYGTPVVARLAGRDQLLLSGQGAITSYDPATGRELWFCRWSAERSGQSVAFGGDCVYASATWRRAEIVCVRADGSGDVTDSHVVWRHGRGACDVPSPLYHDGRLYLLNDGGLVNCLDAATGRPVWQQRLGGAFSASPVLAGDHILAADEDGTTHVFAAGPQFRLLATNPLNDPLLASPALSGDRIFLRGRNTLWCVGPGAAPAQPVPARPPGVRVLSPDVRPGRQLPSAGPPLEDNREGSWRAWLGAVACCLVILLLTTAGWLLASQWRSAADEPSPASGAGGQAGPPAAPPAVAFTCPGCRTRLRAGATAAGKRIRCPRCGEGVLVPRPGQIQGK